MSTFGHHARKRIAVASFTQYIYGIITARKRSLVQGNIFTGICLSTEPPLLDTDPPGQRPPIETPLDRDLRPPYGKEGSGTHTTGMHSCCILASQTLLLYMIRYLR